MISPTDSRATNLKLDPRKLEATLMIILDEFQYALGAQYF
jgi:hypothetical protein